MIGFLATDADRHDDISRNGSSGFGGSADSAEMGDLGDVVGESNFMHEATRGALLRIDNQFPVMLGSRRPTRPTHNDPCSPGRPYLGRGYCFAPLPAD